MKKRILTYCEAINEALLNEMARDERIFIYGLDVADHKRTFGSGVGILEKYGGKRLFSTPLSEDALMGFGLGSAINGLKPINVHIRVDFLLLAMNQIVNMVSSFRYGTGGKVKVPLIIRAVVGRGWGQGFQHSKTLHSLFAHIPGLKVVMPTRPKDAKGMLISAIRDDNPVLFIEHRWLYWMKGDVPEKAYTIELGKSKVLKEGKDITVVAVSWMNIEARKAAEVLNKKHRVSIEIIDPRTIVPLDDQPIIQSVNKTGHCIVADYDWLFSGFSAEIASRVSEACFKTLKSPVTRIGFAHTPCPTTRPLENKFYPTAVEIIRAVEKKLKLKPANLKGEEFYSYENKFKGPF